MTVRSSTLFPLARQLMNQSHPSGDQAHEGRFLQHAIAREQLLVEPRGGVGRYRGAVEERGGDGHGFTGECKEDR